MAFAGVSAETYCQWCMMNWIDQLLHHHIPILDFLEKRLDIEEIKELLIVFC